VNALNLLSRRSEKAHAPGPAWRLLVAVPQLAVVAVGVFVGEHLSGSERGAEP